MKTVRNEVSLSAAFTTTLWVGCLAIGVIGVVLPYHRNPPPKPGPLPIEAQVLQVQLTTEPLPPIDQAPPPPNLSTPPPAMKTLPPPSAPALIPVAAPNPAIAFELPVVGPTQVVEVKQAAYAAPAEKPVVAAPAVPQPQTLVYGRGEGVQPAPEYPTRAKFEGQEGRVLVLFTVGTDGRPVTAELKAPCPWPLLNEAALKVIRDKWRFRAGPIRQWEVAIQFQLNKKS